MSKSGEIAVVASGMFRSQVEMTSDMLARELLEVSVGRADAKRVGKRSSMWVSRFMIQGVIGDDGWFIFVQLMFAGSGL
jgi:hypothetical protein